MSRSRFAAVAPAIVAFMGPLFPLATSGCNTGSRSDTNPSSAAAASVASTATAAASSPPPRASSTTPVAAAGAPSSDEVEVPAGRFLMGCVRRRDGECNFSYERRHEVELDAFLIDRPEVTVADYRRCTEAGRCSTDGLGSQTALGGYTVDCNWNAGRERHPINCVDWAGAAAYCAWAGKRLPTEAEWEKAARGTDGRIYPWGNDRPGRRDESDDRVVILDLRAPSLRDAPPRHAHVNTTWPVGSRPAGKSPYGALDMLGNVWEWTADWFDREAYAVPDRRNPQGPSTGSTRVVRGGYHALTMRISERMQLGPTIRSGLLGFRCARSAP